ncbi:hypothetical protein RIF25_16400 [Thermosynechococcaceae cyanobacterium BACA0444]|uniref:SWIM-type domain-containing protein n=1 Tax=Pseudocalidococcus azoricus BACA0444 TaxID=2918990 RepID=A0AAE4JXC5_9CYAN|nr:hypothetical protein [Pseudocalidococcus azoricus]MDS3862380.1 hypothetical protein [Pseudocalidococcus azoricus BACA0444]
MTTKSATDLIYTAANAARILGKRFQGLQIQVWFNCVYVHTKGQFSRFISKASFKQMFVDFRKAGAKALTVTANLFVPNTFKVRNGTKDTAYDVLIIEKNITCGCEDYNNQMEAFNKGVCKHGYAVLNHLGYNSLADYVRA